MDKRHNEDLLKIDKEAIRRNRAAKEQELEEHKKLLHPDKEAILRNKAEAERQNRAKSADILKTIKFSPETAGTPKALFLGEIQREIRKTFPSEKPEGAGEIETLVSKCNWDNPEDIDRVF